MENIYKCGCGCASFLCSGPVLTDVSTLGKPSSIVTSEHLPRTRMGTTSVITQTSDLPLAYCSRRTDHFSSFYFHERPSLPHNVGLLIRETGPGRPDFFHERVWAVPTPFGRLRSMFGCSSSIKVGRSADWRCVYPVLGRLVVVCKYLQPGTTNTCSSAEWAGPTVRQRRDIAGPVTVSIPFFPSRLINWHNYLSFRHIKGHRTYKQFCPLMKHDRKKGLVLSP